MLFDFNRFSSLLLIFFVHGVVYAALLFRKSRINETRSDRWLGIFLLLCILYITPWMVGFAGWYDNQPYRDILFYTPFQHLYFIGPVVFFYVQSLLNPGFRFGKKEWLHLVPGILYLLFSLVMLVTDKWILDRYYFLADGQDPDFDAWYQLSGLALMMGYLVLSLRYYLLYRKWVVQVISYAELVMFRWIRNFLLAFLLMLLFRFGFYVASFFMDTDYWSTWWYFLLFAIIFYYIAIVGYSNSVETKVTFSPGLLGYRRQMVLEYRAQPELFEEAEVIEIDTATPSTPADNLQVAEWKAKLEALLKDQRAYEDPELSLAEVARQLQSNASFISKMINQGFEINFNDWVNQYRVKAVKEKLDKEEFRTKTLLGIAFESGFNSKATFNRAFRKLTGLSPRDYIKGLKSGSGSV
jgi:AraC-like DNA-binding protein